MLKKSIFQQAARFTLAASLATPSFGFSAERKLIFPGQALPPELGLSSLKVGSHPEAEVQVMARDWFLLKDKELSLANPVPGKNIDYVGPILETTNAQMYFRLISGMILKESMLQLGMSSSRAKRFLESVQLNGKDFQQTPLKDLGELPEGLKELYNEWNRPNKKMAILPYMILPLAVAHDQSQFQHFFKGKVEDTETQKSCTTNNTAAPLNLIQTKLNEKNKMMEGLDTELRDANSRLEKSNLDQMAITGSIKELSTAIDQSSDCFNSIRSRVSRGGEMPNKKCLDDAGKDMSKAKMDKEWIKFVTSNLKNEKGDFAAKQQAELELKAMEARLAEMQNSIKLLQDEQDKAKSELVENESNTQKLKERLAGEKVEHAKLLDAEKQKLAEKENLLKLSIQMQSEEYRELLGEVEYAKKREETPARNNRLAALKNEITDVLKKKTAFDISQAALTTQLGHLAKATDDSRARIKSAEAQLLGEAGLLKKASVLEAQVSAANKSFISIQDEAAFSEYVLAVLARRTAGLSQQRDIQLNALKKEEEYSEKYKKVIQTATEKKEKDFPGVSTEVGNLQALIASYRDVQKMGWFLETDCLARTSLGGSAPGVYLGRAKIADSGSKVIPTSPVDGGRWGLFNLDYNHFAENIQSGILLNVPSYIQMAVHQLTQNFDFAITQQWDTTSVKCNDPEAAKGAAGSIMNAMKSAFSIWADGSNDQAKLKALQCRFAAATVAQPVQVTAPAVPAAPAADSATGVSPLTSVTPAQGTLPVPSQAQAFQQLAPGPARLYDPRAARMQRWQQRPQQQGQRLPRQQRPGAAPIVRAPVVQQGLAARNFMSSLNRLIAFDGSVLDMTLPQAGRSHDRDLIERKAISALARELGIMNGQINKDSVPSDVRREELIKALIQVLAYDYEAELAKQNAVSAEKAKFEYVFATSAPGRQVSTAGLVVGKTYSVKTTGKVRTYTAPVAKAAYESAVELNYNDKVKVLPVDGTEKVSEAGWVKVEANKMSMWMPAAAIASSVILDENGQEISGASKPQNCENPRVVTELTNFQNSNTFVQRFSPNIKTEQTSRRSGIWTVDVYSTEKVAPASTQKTYLACENFAVNGQSAVYDVAPELTNAAGVDFGKVQAIRIIEARKILASNGETLFVPVEAVGGFVQTWLHKKNVRKPRITLGNEVDTTTWSLKK